MLLKVKTVGTSRLVEIYNHFNAGAKDIKKFQDRATAEKRTEALIAQIHKTNPSRFKQLLGTASDEVRKYFKKANGGAEFSALFTMKEKLLLKALWELGEKTFHPVSKLAQKLGVKEQRVHTLLKRLEKHHAVSKMASSNNGEVVILLEAAAAWIKKNYKNINGDKVDISKRDHHHPGKRSKYTGKRIYKLIKTNPRRKGTWGWRSWEVIQHGMSYEDFIAAGGRRVDLAWDESYGRVEIK